MSNNNSTPLPKNETSSYELRSNIDGTSTTQDNSNSDHNSNERYQDRLCECRFCDPDGWLPGVVWYEEVNGEEAEEEVNEGEMDLECNCDCRNCLEIKDGWVPWENWHEEEEERWNCDCSWCIVLNAMRTRKVLSCDPGFEQEEGEEEIE